MNTLELLAVVFTGIAATSAAVAALATRKAAKAAEEALLKQYGPKEFRNWTFAGGEAEANERASTGLTRAVERLASVLADARKSPGNPGSTP
jgi:hypothetical protein